MALICDTLRSASMNYDDPMQVEEVLSKRIEKTYDEAQHSAHTLQMLADGLPALGIVAAVLGVIKTMASIDQPPGDPRQDDRRRAGRHLPRRLSRLRHRRALRDAG